MDGTAGAELANRWLHGVVVSSFCKPASACAPAGGSALRHFDDVAVLEHDLFCPGQASGLDEFVAAFLSAINESPLRVGYLSPATGALDGGGGGTALSQAQ